MWSRLANAKESRFFFSMKPAATFLMTRTLTVFTIWGKIGGKKRYSSTWQDDQSPQCVYFRSACDQGCGEILFQVHGCTTLSSKSPFFSSCVSVLFCMFCIFSSSNTRSSSASAWGWEYLANVLGNAAQNSEVFSQQRNVIGSCFLTFWYTCCHLWARIGNYLLIGQVLQNTIHPNVFEVS